jgi:hypothetical protein
MAIRISCSLAVLLAGLLVLGGCAPAWQPATLEGVALQPGRFLRKYYSSPDLNPLAGGYQVDIFPVTQVRGLGPSQAEKIVNDELVQAMVNNGLEVNREKPRFVLDGAVHRFTVASPAWRFLSGRGYADLQVVGQIRRGQELVFAFQDQVSINPHVHPRHRPTLEPDLIARQAARSFAVNLLNELLLPTGRVPGEGLTAPSLPTPSTP